MIAHKYEVKHSGVVSALLIDDNMFDRRRFSRIADETNLEFFLRDVADAEDFGNALDQDKYDIIFIDLNLGAVNGMSLLPIVRAHQVNKNAAVIMVAGDSDAEVALQALREGFADYIEKDVLSHTSLERATLNALQKSRLSNDAISAKADTQTVESVLNSFSQACSLEMRPLMARMVRQVRQVKTMAQAYGASDDFLEIESTCARIDEFFQDLSGLSKEGQLSSFVEDSLNNPTQAQFMPAAKSSELSETPPGEHTTERPSAKRPSRPSLFNKR